ncbi:MAG: tetratricopeptide repeat protein, partial [candidate division Zixibacteria bacterium]|nr:tetratricopeptide repeat protein [candidate division Zixibacteria bacterium]
SGRVRILDFGLAKSHRATTETKVGSTLGTVQYESPEQSRGEAVDARSDLFSVGVLLYEMITGKLPFSGDYDEAIRYAISYEEAQPLSRYASGISDDIQRLVSKLLQKEVSLRYQSAEGVLSDLLLLARSGTGTAPQAKTRKNRWPQIVGTIVIVAALVAAAFKFWPADNSIISVSEIDERKMLVVLPFENLGLPDDEYFADGITDEITSRLAVVKGLRVISRTSAMKYKQTNKTIPEIGSELGVDYVLEGTIRWDKSGDTDLVRITPQLIKVADDFHVWADNIERPLTHIFRVQTDIAMKIVHALGVALVDNEQQALAQKPTENMQAYDYYLKGNVYIERTRGGDDEGAINLAIELYQRAVDGDTKFVPAREMLALTLIERYWHWSFDTLDLMEARKHIDIIRSQAPASFEALVATGSYHYHEGEYDQALDKFTRAREIQPNNAYLETEIAFVHRRQGKSELALSDLESALVLDPRSSGLYDQAGLTALWLHKYDLAEKYFSLAIALGPDVSGTYANRAFLCIIQRGDLARAREIMNTAFRLTKLSGVSYVTWGQIELLSGNYDKALELYAKAEFWLAPGIGFTERALIYEMMGQPEQGQLVYDSGRVELEEKLKTTPMPAPIHSALGIIFAGLGNTEKAVGHGQLGLELQENEFLRSWTLSDMARIYVMLGDYEAALDQLELTVGLTSVISAHTLRINPYWKQLKENPRFKALVKKYESLGS